jgi:hypothetical protein
MSLDEEDRFVAFLTDTFGASLRSVLRYEHGDHELVYLREDLDTLYDEDDVEEVIDYLVHESLGREATERRYPHGDLKCEIEVYEEATELNFVFGRGRGVAVGVDSTGLVAQSVFVGKCLELLDVDEQLDEPEADRGTPDVDADPPEFED